MPRISSYWSCKERFVSVFFPSQQSMSTVTDEKGYGRQNSLKQR